MKSIQSLFWAKEWRPLQQSHKPWGGCSSGIPSDGISGGCCWNHSTIPSLNSSVSNYDTWEFRDHRHMTQMWGPSRHLYCHQANVSRYAEGDVRYMPTPVAMSSSLRRTRCTLCPWRCWTIFHTTLTCTVTSLGSWRRPLKDVDTAVMMPRCSNGSSRNRVTLWREAIGWWVSGTPIWTPMGLF